MTDKSINSSCPVINYFRGHSRKWWFRFIIAQLIGFCSATAITIDKEWWEKVDKK